jgi:hypothetical protein
MFFSLTNGTAMPTGGPTTTTTGFTTNTSSSSSSSTMFSTISPLIYPCERDIAIAIDMSTSMINTNNRQNVAECYLTFTVQYLI